MVAWRYKISRAVDNISLVLTPNIFQHEKKNFVPPSNHVISSMYKVNFSEPF